MRRRAEIRRAGGGLVVEGVAAAQAPRSGYTGAVVAIHVELVIIVVVDNVVIDVTVGIPWRVIIIVVIVIMIIIILIIIIIIVDLALAPGRWAARGR